MMFLFKNKEVVVDAFISEKYAQAYDYTPIDYAYKFYPEWWKNLPKTELDFDTMNRKNSSMKMCAGFIDHYSKGLIIPTWSELMIRTENDGSWRYQFADSQSRCDEHHVSQRRGFREDLLNIKIISPWLLRSEKSVQFNYLPTFYNNETDSGYSVAMGTTNYYYQNSTHINMLVEKNKKILIPLNQPMLHLVPLTERRIKLKRHLITDAEWERENRRMMAMNFFGAYLKLKKHREKMEESQPKCPFHNIFK